ncbi:MAG: hypothetical protein WC164_04815 [Patescibacteria group bacterium]
MENNTERFFDEAARIAGRRVASLFAQGRLRHSFDGMVEQWGHDHAPIRSFDDLSHVFPVFHREAYREVRARAGVPANRATWEWHQVVK